MRNNSAKWRYSSSAVGARSSWLLAAALSVAGMAAVAACGASSSSGGGAGSNGGATVTAVQTSVGTVLAGPSGATAYVLLSSQGASLPCEGACTSTWMPVTVSSGAAPQAGSGVSTSLTVAARSDGSMQVAANGNPLYYYTGDNGSGQVNGQGIKSFGGTWYAVDTNGKPVQSGGSSSSGYGY